MPVDYKKQLCLLYFLLILATTIYAAKTDAQYCDVPIGSKSHFRFQWPLIFNKAGVLYETTKTADGSWHVRVPHDAEVLLSCSPNYFKKYFKLETVEARCQGATGNFSLYNKAALALNVVEGTAMNIKDLSCDLRVIEEVLHDVEGCTSRESTATQFGYVDPKDEQAVLLGEACYDMMPGVTRWAHVKLGTKPTTNYLQKVEKSFLTRNQHPNVRYKIEFFRGLSFLELYERLQTQLRMPVSPGLMMASYIDETLLPSAQFLAVKKLAWNYFVTHDELQVLDALKADMQLLSQSQDLDIYVGSSGVFSMEGTESGTKVDVYLHAPPSKRFPVPELIWFVVRQGDKASAFVVFNAVDITPQQVMAKKICQSECDKISWLKTVKKLTEKDSTGLVCCSYADLSKTVGVPQLQGIKELLV